MPACFATLRRLLEARLKHGGREYVQVLRLLETARWAAPALVIPAAEALAAAHTSGVTHRDLKPANVILRAKDGRAVITDFGVSRMHDRLDVPRAERKAHVPSQSKLTVEGALSGDSDAIIDGGTMTFAASVSGTVIFEGSGELVLGQAENALFNCRGFATDGQTSLDLEDVGFAGADEITSEITDNEAILMVKGANRTVQFTLVGDYLGVTFTAKSANGGAGSIITASQTTEAAKFVQAAAAFTTTGTSATATHGVTTPQSPSLFNLASGHG